jgi:hypothetical protein
MKKRRKRTAEYESFSLGFDQIVDPKKAARQKELARIEMANPGAIGKFLGRDVKAKILEVKEKLSKKTTKQIKGFVAEVGGDTTFDNTFLELARWAAGEDNWSPGFHHDREMWERVLRYVERFISSPKKRRVSLFSEIIGHGIAKFKKEKADVLAWRVRHRMRPETCELRKKLREGYGIDEPKLPLNSLAELAGYPDNAFEKWETSLQAKLRERLDQLAREKLKRDGLEGGDAEQTKNDVEQRPNSSIAKNVVSLYDATSAVKLQYEKKKGSVTIAKLCREYMAKHMIEDKPDYTALKLADNVSKRLEKERNTKEAPR